MLQINTDTSVINRKFTQREVEQIAKAAVKKTFQYEPNRYLPNSYDGSGTLRRNTRDYPTEQRGKELYRSGDRVGSEAIQQIVKTPGAVFPEQTKLKVSQSTNNIEFIQERRHAVILPCCVPFSYFYS